MVKSLPITRRDRLAYRKYYSTGEELLKLNMKLITTISNYALSQNNPQIVKECMEVVQHTTQAKKAEDILKFVIMYDFTEQELFNFLIKSITEVYH
jgi:hypothetical protein